MCGTSKYVSENVFNEKSDKNNTIYYCENINAYSKFNNNHRKSFEQLQTKNLKQIIIPIKIYK